MKLLAGTAAAPSDVSWLKTRAIAGVLLLLALLSLGMANEPAATPPPIDRAALAVQVRAEFLYA